MKTHARLVWVVTLCLTVMGSSLGAEKVDDTWLKQVAALPAEKQVEAVAKKLKELNPDFDPDVGRKIEKGVVTQFSFVMDAITDISPVRALAGIKLFSCEGSKLGKGKLSDLSPLKGMPLTELSFGFTKVADLSPLKGMPLTGLDFSSTPVSDLSPLNGMHLTRVLHFSGQLGR